MAPSAEIAKTFSMLQRCLLEPINLYGSASKMKVDLKPWKVHKSSDDRKCKTEFGKKKTVIYFKIQAKVIIVIEKTAHKSK